MQEGAASLIFEVTEVGSKLLFAKYYEGKNMKVLFSEVNFMNKQLILWFR